MVTRYFQSLITLALGEDTAGNQVVGNLASMPHLLVAGASGAEKSVYINSLIFSLLFKATPDEVKLLLIDSKRVEMRMYQDVPHLVHPVITDMAMAKNALDWAVKEMHQRYESLAFAGVWNITEYNAKPKRLGVIKHDGLNGQFFMPYLVIIIHELAEVMEGNAKEVESSIVRLAQLARAVGIHLILATHWLRANVVTGLIKVNFPYRIAFRVTSTQESHAILDIAGAEDLLGKGDMLLKSGGGHFQRMHGAFVSDGTVTAVVDYWKRLVAPSCKVHFADWSTAVGADDDISSDKSSISFLQRRFRIGYNKTLSILKQG